MQHSKKYAIVRSEIHKKYLYFGKLDEEGMKTLGLYSKDIESRVWDF